MPSNAQLNCLKAAAEGRLFHRISQAGTSDTYEEPPKWAGNTRDPRYGQWRPVSNRTFRLCLLEQWLQRGVQRDERWFPYTLSEKGREQLIKAEASP